jgi:hypothetical protein
MEYFLKLITPKFMAADITANSTKLFPNFFDFSRWILVINYVYIHMISPWGAIPIVFILALIFAIIKRQKGLFVIFFIAVTFLLMLLAGTFVNSYLQVSGDWLAVGDAATRLSMFMYPVFIFCVALVIGKYRN